ncbi:MAG: hypothetical protein JOY90_24115 [Bradyrhizobium sp.]|nr:hypothetical protein [Bradyrhizobium sp.]MBV9563504.1 hypothetical protein [Bradyrhizobium sp.]
MNQAAFARSFFAGAIGSDGHAKAQGRLSSGVWLSTAPLSAFRLSI